MSEALGDSARDPAPVADSGDAAQAGSGRRRPGAPAELERHSAPESAIASEAADDARSLEQLTLSELILHFRRAPLPTWRRLRQAAAAESARGLPIESASIAMPLPPPTRVDRGARAKAAIRAAPLTWRNTDVIKLLLYSAAIILALIGSVLARGTDQAQRANDYALSLGAPFLWLGFLLWLAAEIAGRRARLTAGWQALDRRARLHWAARSLPALLALNSLFTFTASMTAPHEEATPLALHGLAQLTLAGGVLLAIELFARRARGRRPATNRAEPRLLARSPARKPILRDISRWRMALVMLAALSSLIVWTNTTGNRIEPPVILLWLLSAALWGFVFAPLRWNLFDWASGRIDVFRRFRWREHRPAIIALALIMLLGAAFRLHQLDAYPPQMYSDLVEKIQDAYRIHHFDDYHVFFTNTGGRDPLHFYLLSLLASQPGLAFDHYSLKLMSALESLMTLPLVFWLGVEVMAGRRRGFAWVVGALAAALVAVSFWHAGIGRQGMRISLAPLFSALVAICLARGLRHNRRSDFALAGIALGFGLTGYQAVRALPLAAVLGVAIALVLARQSWRARLSYSLNLAALAFISLMVFLPLLHFWVEYPDAYMRRTNTRIFGDEPTTDAQRIDFLMGSVPVLMSNIRKTALFYHYYGDSAWVSGLAHEPAMDPASAAFLLLGLAAWLALMAKWRDPVAVFVPVYLLVTLLPTTLSLSFPREVPSMIRASGAIPPSYLMAALPIALFCRQLRIAIAGRKGKLAALLFAAGVALAANHYNTSLYFGEFNDAFRDSAHPHAQAGAVLRGFAESDGAYGNAFVLTSPHWWDVRAVGIEGGAMFWDSGGEVGALPRLLERGLWRQAQFRLDPERDLLFFYSQLNQEAATMLSQWFPQGRQLTIEVEPARNSFHIYRAPALGADGIDRFIAENRGT